MESPQFEIRVAFLGPLASFSHQAALESFGSESTLLPQPSFADAFQAVQSNAADYAVIPFENSTNGSVVQTLDLLADRDGLYSDISVCGEYYLTVHQSLMVKKPEGNGVMDTTPDQRYKSITKLYTHPQAWGQCETFLSAHFKGVERQDVSSTSKAAEIVSKEEGHSSAAIASKFAADFHGLEVLAENIEDRANNTTRFLILENVKSGNQERRKNWKSFPPGLPPSPDLGGRPKKFKSLISFMIDHNSPGALVNALKVFERYGMNLTSINSRPGLLKPWQYIFFVECARIPGVHGDDAVGDVMKNLREVTETCRDLGSWRDQLKTPS